MMGVLRRAPRASEQRTDWIVDRLESWGRWLQLGSNPYGASSLTIDPDHDGPLQAYIPVIDVDCEKTNEAVMKQARQLQEVAAALYVKRWDRQALAKHLRVTPRHVTRLHEMLRNGVQYSLENQSVRTPLASGLENVSSVRYISATLSASCVKSENTSPSGSRRAGFFFGAVMFAPIAFYLWCGAWAKVWWPSNDG
ncbi:hypothetical protein [Cupriavidus basilensis]